MADKIILYWTSITATVEIEKEQQRIEMVLDAKNVEYEKVDISLVEGAKEKMYELVGKTDALPPQLTKGNTYLGGYDAFFEAVECENLDEFLKIKQ